MPLAVLLQLASVTPVTTYTPAALPRVIGELAPVAGVCAIEFNVKATDQRPEPVTLATILVTVAPAQ